MGAQSGRARCESAVLEGELAEGAMFAQTFTPGLRILLEPVRAGWMVRVIDERAPRGDHDFAEIATPPYRSVTPLAVTTDFSFRSQDAVAWNPRRFRYAANAQTFARLKNLYAPAMQGNAAAASELGTLVEQQPAGELKILDARIAPGANDQARMAAMVASHFADTPHTVDMAAASSPLGRVEWMKFRVTIELPIGVRGAPGVRVTPRVCANDTTAAKLSASHM